MRILFISTLYPVKSGHYSSEVITHALHDFVRAWSKDNEVRVIRPLIINANPVKPFHYYPKHIVSPGEYVLDGINISAVPVYRIPKTEIFLTGKLERSIHDSDFKPDVIIAHFGRSIIIGAKIAKKMELPFICGLHNTDITHLNKKDHFRRILMNALVSSKACSCRAPHILKKFSNMGLMEPGRIFGAYSGIPKSMIDSVSFLSKSEVSWKKGRKTVFSTAASLIPLKNIDVNIKALNRLQSDWEYHIIGEGPEKAALSALVDSLHIERKVIFHGGKTREETMEILKTSDIYIMVSAPETFGMAYLEAMATGNIVIGSKGCGIDGIIRDGENGYLVAPESVEDLSKTLEEIIFNSEKEKLQKILKASFETVSGMRSEDMAEKYLFYVRKAVKANKSGEDF